MALITCKDCKKEFSTDAKRCPHCGAKKPGSKIVTYGLGILVLLLAVSQCEGQRLIKDAEQRQAVRAATIPAPATPSVASSAAPNLPAAQSPPSVHVDLKQYQRCKQTEKMVDGLLESSMTYCWLTADPDSPQKKMMIIAATLPAFSSEATRRAWLISVMGAAGYLMHEKKTPISTIIKWWSLNRDSE
jgi:hypothetical protein